MEGVWIGDSGYESSASLQINGKPSNSRAIHQLASLDSVPYSKTARVSHHEFSYVFPVINPGQKFIRLHFYQDSYKGFKRSKALFTVKAAPYTLLSNFSTAALTSGAKQIIKEYCVNIDDGRALTITFSPAQRRRKSDDFYAFVNGIEVVSMPTGLYFTPEGELGAIVVGQKYRFYIDNSTACSADGMKTPTTFWKQVLFLIRLHFSEFQLRIAKSANKDFFIVINNQIAEDKANVIKWGGTSGLAVYRDYIVMMEGDTMVGKRYLTITFLPQFESRDKQFHGVLNALEVFKLSNPDNNLAGTGQDPESQSSISTSQHKKPRSSYSTNLIATVLTVILGLLNVAVYHLRRVSDLNS